MTNPLTHFDDTGASRMVDVSDKPITLRTAIAEGYVTLQPSTLERITNLEISKGNVLEVARLAGIMAAKQTANLIPLCHPLPLDGIKIEFNPDPKSGCIRIQSEVRTTGRTGVEIEALTAIQIAALTIYDMCKSVERGIELGPFRLLEKQGGNSGHYQHPSSTPTPTESDSH